MSERKHSRHQSIWEAEHADPKLFPQLDSEEQSGGVERFYVWMKQHTNGAEFLKYGRGLEMGCGKGRNTVWLAEQGVNMAGFDFSSTAISVARARAKKRLLNNVSFKIMDATETWEYPSGHFDFIIDCFASVDIELNIEHVFNEVHRVLSPGGFFLCTRTYLKQRRIKNFTYRVVILCISILIPERWNGLFQKKD